MILKFFGSQDGKIEKEGFILDVSKKAKIEWYYKHIDKNASLKTNIEGDGKIRLILKDKEEKIQLTEEQILLLKKEIPEKRKYEISEIIIEGLEKTKIEKIEIV